MVSSVKMILALTVLATAACTGYAIKCYECDSLRNSECGKDFKPDKRLVLDCDKIVSLNAPDGFLKVFSPDTHATGCIKETLKNLGEPLIKRSCHFVKTGDTKVGCKTDPSLLSCELCTKDECNGSSALAPIAGVILLFFGLARLLA